MGKRTSRPRCESVSLYMEKPTSPPTAHIPHFSPASQGSFIMPAKVDFKIIIQCCKHVEINFSLHEYTWSCGIGSLWSASWVPLGVLGAGRGR